MAGASTETNDVIMGVAMGGRAMGSCNAPASAPALCVEQHFPSQPENIPLMGIA